MFSSAKLSQQVKQVLNGKNQEMRTSVNHLPQAQAEQNAWILQLSQIHKSNSITVSSSESTMAFPALILPALMKTTIDSGL